jgi:hypothetical protein
VTGFGVPAKGSSRYIGFSQKGNQSIAAALTNIFLTGTTLHIDGRGRLSWLGLRATVRRGGNLLRARPAFRRIISRRDARQARGASAT